MSVLVVGELWLGGARPGFDDGAPLRLAERHMSRRFRCGLVHVGVDLIHLTLRETTVVVLAGIGVLDGVDGEPEILATADDPLAVLGAAPLVGAFPASRLF